jgi:hypothetical protein
MGVIAGAQTLWYIKTLPAKHYAAARIRRQPVTLTLGILHRLSELCRYQPLKLSALLRRQENWLLAEFLNVALAQSLDELASEITGLQFLVPGVRHPALT